MTNAKRLFIIGGPNGVGKTTLSRVMLKDRVKAGGHQVDDITVRRRYIRSHQMFRDVYSKISDSWYMFDNTGSIGSLVAKMEFGEIFIVDPTVYSEVFANGR